MPLTVISRQVISSVVLCCTVALIGCGSSDSSSSSTPSTVSEQSDATLAVNDAATNLSSVDVPEAYISYQDGSATVAAVRSGVDVDTHLIDTTFSCYDEDATDIATPYLSFTVTGSTFVSTLGNGTINYEPERGDFILSGGGFDNEDNVYLRFDSYGQSFTADAEDADVVCFQAGASQERAVHQFLLNTPELGDYTCTEVETNEQHTLRFSEGGQYQTSAGAGLYDLSELVDSSSSQIDFRQGPLDGEDVSYREDPDTGRQEFRFSNTEVFGLAAGSSSSLTFVCARVREPRPYTQYGFAAATAVSTPNTTLNGPYFYNDIVTSTNHSYLYAGYYNFRSDGFLRREYPGAIPDDCNRTAPNGLNYCDSYLVDGGELYVYEPNGRQIDVDSIQVDGSGTVTSISGDATEPVTASDASYIEGTFYNNEFRQSGCTGVGFCSSSYNERTYIFALDGRFVYFTSGQNISSAEFTDVSSFVLGNSSNDSTGFYEIRGNRLLLQFLDGTLENRFIYRISDGDLAVDGLLFLDETDDS